jgi:phosphoglycolate phosphatase
MYKAVIFDLDGTLLDTLEDLALSFNYVLYMYGKTPRKTEEYKYLVGEGTNALLMKILPDFNEEEIEQARKIFEKYYEKQFDKNTRLYTDINKVLTFFQARGYKLAVLSNKPNNFTKKCALKYLRAWNFDVVYGIREGIARKPDAAGVVEILKELHVDAHECIFIGDTKIDMLTAKNSNMDSIGVLWGFRDELELREHGAKYIVEHPKDIIKLISRLQN